MLPEGNSYNTPAKPDPVNINAPRDYDANTYLHELCARGSSPALIREAVKMGADINKLNRQNMPPLGVAILKGYKDTVETLLDLGADMFFDTGKEAFFNATYLAASSGNKEKLDVILAKGGGVYVNRPGIDGEGNGGWHALHIALKRWHDDLIPTLVEAGAFLDTEAGYNKATPLMLAISNDSEGSVTKLVTRGASLEYKQSETGNTPLLHACANGKPWVAERLLLLGADPEARNNESRNALMLAAANGNLRLVNELLKYKPDLNARAKNGETALMLAASGGNTEVVNALLKAGADPLLTDTFNKSATAYAESRNNYSTRWALEEAEKLALQKQFEATYKKLKPGG